jgi:hypothetical protein
LPIAVYWMKVFRIGGQQIDLPPIPAPRRGSRTPIRPETCQLGKGSKACFFKFRVPGSGAEAVPVHEKRRTQLGGRMPSSRLPRGYDTEQKAPGGQVSASKAQAPRALLPLRRRLKPTSRRPAATPMVDWGAHLLRRPAGPTVPPTAVLPRRPRFPRSRVRRLRVPARSRRHRRPIPDPRSARPRTASGAVNGRRRRSRPDTGKPAVPAAKLPVRERHWVALDTSHVVEAHCRATVRRSQAAALRPGGGPISAGAAG